MILTEYHSNALLRIEEMYAADRAAIEGGRTGTALMDAAGAAVARAIRLRWRARPTVILCGPGNNGGDGFVVAGALKKAGWPVTVTLLGAPEKLPPDAAAAYEDWRTLCQEAGTTAIAPFDPSCLANAELMVDALFGAGLQRPLDGKVHDLVQAAVARVSQSAVPVAAVDVPSGVNGDTGQVDGIVLPADITVTFFRPKPGHYLLPGAQLCGEIIVADIGIPVAVLDDIAPKAAVNGPALWRSAIPAPQPAGHKYHRGHVLVIAGAMPGAAVLAARSAARAGAGMVTIGDFIPAKVESTKRLQITIPASIMTAAFQAVEQVLHFCRDRKVQTVIIGPGFGDAPKNAQVIEEILRHHSNCILDADGISVFRSRADALDRIIGPQTILTPHAGEFSRIIPDNAALDALDKLSRSRAAAARFHATIVHKGYDTVIADADGRAVINANGTPDLATAGTGDVLAGLIGGLRAQGMDAFEAAAAGVWLHADAGHRAGPCLIADDLPEFIPQAIRNC